MIYKRRSVLASHQTVTVDFTELQCSPTLRIDQMIRHQWPIPASPGVDVDGHVNASRNALGRDLEILSFDDYS
jgi:hypothetical protein